MRVLTVVDALRLGGAETLIAQLARVAPATDIELQVLSLHGDTPEFAQLAPVLREAGVEPQFLGVSRTIDVPAFRRLIEFIRAAKPDVVHAHLEMAMTMALPAARIAGVPAIGTFHHVHRPLDGRAALRERLAVEVATRSDATIFVSNASLVSFADKYRANKPVPSTWTVVHNGIDVSYFTPPAPGERPRMPSDLGLGDSNVITVLAALRDFKGIRQAIAAWPEVHTAHPDRTLLLVGTGEEEQSLRAQVAQLGIEGSVVFAGMRSDIPEILRASEFTVLPSIYGENLPTVLMEAGACGRPVVASDVGGIADIVADGVTGLLVPPGDSAAVARAMLTLLDDPDRAAAMGAAGRARIVERFDGGLWARNLYSLYSRVIAEKSGLVEVPA